MTMPTPEPEISQAQAQNNQKVIVALFLLLGKALEALPFNKRNLEISETEIRRAWTAQKSPVRITSEVRATGIPSLDDPGAETYYSGLSERYFKPLLQELDLKVTGIKAGEKFPEINTGPEGPAVKSGERRRVFDLE